MSKLVLVVAAFSSAVALSGANNSDGGVFNCMSGFGGQRFRLSVFVSATGTAKAFAEGALSITTPCDVVEKSLDCIKQSPHAKLTVFSGVFEKTISDRCGDNNDAKFWSGFLELEQSWQGQSKLDGCEGGVVKSVDEACKKLSECTFGTALDAVKGKYRTEVTDFTIDFTKFVIGAAFEAVIPDELPQSCDLLFKP